jgi:hypothetical protein
MAVQIPLILAFLARQGLQATIKKYGRSAVSKATSKAAKDAAKRSTKVKNKEVLKQIDKKKIEEKASENILKRQMEKEGVESLLTKGTKAKVTRPVSKGKTAEKNARKESWKSKDPAERRGPYASPRQAQKSRDTVKDKARQRRLEKEREGQLEDVFVEEGEPFLDKFITEGGDPIPLKFAKGGDVDDQMAMLMPEEEMMEEEIMEEELVEQPVLPDEEMEDDYLDFVVSQALEPEEQELLMDVLDESPQLSIIFDKLMDVATEFSGAGPVDGPGSEVSDSIPARLSDGEFVITAKATDQIGADRLQSMMEDAEAEADVVRQEVAEGGEIEDEPEVDSFGKPVDEDIAEDEIKKGMLSVNPRLQ